MTKSMFAFALLIMIGSVLTADFCQKFVRNPEDKNVLFFKRTQLRDDSSHYCGPDIHVFIGEEFWNIRLNETKNKDIKDINDMNLTFYPNGNDSYTSLLFDSFQDNLMAFGVKFNDSVVKSVVISKDRKQLIWCEWTREFYMPDTFQISGSLNIDWIKDNMTMGLFEYQKSDSTQEVIILEKGRDRTTKEWLLRPKWFSFDLGLNAKNDSLTDVEKKTKKTDVKALEDLRSKFDIIGVFPYKSGFIFVFKDGKRIRWCWTAKNSFNQKKCKDPKTLVDCSYMEPESGVLMSIFLALLFLMVLAIIVSLILGFVYYYILKPKSTANRSADADDSVRSSLTKGSKAKSSGLPTNSKPMSTSDTNSPNVGEGHRKSSEDIGRH